MRRRVFTFVSVLSLLVAAVSFYPWSRSHASGYRAVVAWKNSTLLAVESLEGRLTLAVFWYCPTDIAFRSEQVRSHMWISSMSGTWSDGSYTDDAWLVESTSRGAAGILGPTAVSPTVFLPYRCIVLRYRGIFSLLLILPLLWGLTRLVRLAIASARVRHGLCPKCSYDLTGNTSGVCPECGTAIPQASRSA